MAAETVLPEAVVFDFDGVILESLDVKTRAFATLFADEEPQAVAKILEHHRANGGVSRFEKFRYAYREVLRRSLGAAEEARLGARFNALVEEAVVAADWVLGAREFLEIHHARLPLFVASGTPEEELWRIVERRGLARYFRGVYGTPETKDSILGRIARENGWPFRSLLMVGDALNDYHSAAKVGARFAGRVRPGEPNPFPAGVPVLPDLRGLDLFLVARGSL